MSQSGLTPLHVADWCGYSDISETLVQQGAACEARDVVRLFISPDDVACECGVAVLCACDEQWNRTANMLADSAVECSPNPGKAQL